MKKILIFNTFGIGDVLFTTPLLASIKTAYPNVKIMYIVNGRSGEILKNNPYVDDILVYERDDFLKAYKKHPIAYFKKWYDFTIDLRKQRFDVMIDLSLNRNLGFFFWCCNIPKRVGFDYRYRGTFLTHKIPLKGYEGKHMVDFYLDLLKPLGVMPKTSDLELHLSSDDIKWAKQWLANNGISNDKPIVAIIPGGGASWGAEADKKRWPAAKYAEVIDKIIADYKATVILMGDAKDEQACSAIARLAKSPVHSSVGKTTLLQMAALMKQCRLAILNDGGPLHVAAAVGLRTVSIFGPVDEMVYGPFPSMGHAIVKKNLACQPCYRRFRVAACAHLSCIKDLSVEDVYKKVIERLSQSHEHSLH